MKIKLQILSFFVTLSFFSCGSEGDDQIDSNPILSTDFPVSEKLKFKPFNKYDIFGSGYCIIDGSTLWYFIDSNTERDVGYCYDLKTGEKLSTIALKEVVDNYIISLASFHSRILGDSIQLYTSHNSIKTFAKKDIIENKPMNERKFSIMVAHDSLDVTQMTKLPNGSAFATLGYKYGRSELQKKCTINNKSVVIFNDDKVDSYEVIKYDSFDVKSDDSSIDSEDIIKNAYAGGCREVKENNMVVCSVNRQFILYTFDPSSGNVLNERRYTKLQSGAESGNAIIITNDLKMEIAYMKSNDQYIFCVVKGYFSKKDRELEQRKWKLFVFDWDLNPIKRFDLPNEKKDEYIISNDGKSIYIGKHSNDGLTLSKADIDI